MIWVVKLFRRLPFEEAFLLLGCVLLAISLDPQLKSGDSLARFHDTSILAEHRSESFSKFSLIQPILALPLYGIGSLIGNPQLGVSYFNLVVFLSFLAFLYRRLPTSVNKLTVLLLLAASMYPHHVQEFFGEVLASVFVAVGVFMMEDNLPIAVTFLSLGVAAVPATYPAFVLMMLYQSITRRSAGMMLVVIPAAILFEIEQLLKHGIASAAYASDHGVQTILPYSGQPGFSYPFVFGLLSLIFSFGKGLLFFVPGLFLIFRKDLTFPTNTLETQVKSLLFFTVGLLLVYSRWWSWYGGVFWGPRFFLIACVPASLLFATAVANKRQSLWGAIAVVLLLALSVWGCVQGYLYGLSNSEQCFGNNFQLELLCWYTPEWSPLWRQFVVGFHQVSPLRLCYALWCSVCFVYFAVRMFRKQLDVANSGTPVFARVYDAHGGLE